MSVSGSWPILLCPYCQQFFLLLTKITCCFNLLLFELLNPEEGAKISPLSEFLSNVSYVCCISDLLIEQCTIYPCTAKAFFQRWWGRTGGGGGWSTGWDGLARLCGAGPSTCMECKVQIIILIPDCQWNIVEFVYRLQVRCSG